jgi:hypothetical protein
LLFLGLSGNDNYSNLMNRPQFGLRWKMFELDGLDGNGRVCLVFPPKPEPTPMDSDQIGNWFSILDLQDLHNLFGLHNLRNWHVIKYREGGL